MHLNAWIWMSKMLERLVTVSSGSFNSETLINYNLLLPFSIQLSLSSFHNPVGSVFILLHWSMPRLVFLKPMIELLHPVYIEPTYPTVLWPFQIESKNRTHGHSRSSSKVLELGVRVKACIKDRIREKIGSLWGKTFHSKYLLRN